jgi:hypothetical protein
VHLAGTDTGVHCLHELSLGLGRAAIPGQDVRQRHPRPLVGWREANGGPELIDASAGLIVNPEHEAQQAVRFGVIRRLFERDLKQAERGIHPPFPEQPGRLHHLRASRAVACDQWIAGGGELELGDGACVVASGQRRERADVPRVRKDRRGTGYLTKPSDHLVPVHPGRGGAGTFKSDCPD